MIILHLTIYIQQNQRSTVEHPLINIKLADQLLSGATRNYTFPNFNLI